MYWQTNKDTSRQVSSGQPTDKQANTHTGKIKSRQSDIQADNQTGQQTYRPASRQTYIHVCLPACWPGILVSRQTYIQAGKLAGMHTYIQVRKLACG